MSDNVWDGDGKHVAWITAAGDVFSVATKEKVATVRGTQLYDLTGKLLPFHLQAAGVVRGEGDTTPGAFLDLVR